MAPTSPHREIDPTHSPWIHQVGVYPWTPSWAPRTSHMQISNAPSNAGHGTSLVATPASSHTGCQQCKFLPALLHQRQSTPFVVSLNNGVSDSDQSTSSFHQSNAYQGDSSPAQRLETTTFSLQDSNANNLAAVNHLTSSVVVVQHHNDSASGVNIFMTAPPPPHTHLQQSCLSAVFPS